MEFGALFLKYGTHKMDYSSVTLAIAPCFSSRGNVLCHVCVWVCGGYIVHHFNSTTVLWCHDVTWRHIMNFGMKGLWNIQCGRCLNTRAFSFDTRHEKTDFKVFVVVIRQCMPRPSFFWYDTDFSEFDSADITDYILEKLVSCQKKKGCGHACPSFFWYDNDKDLKVCFLVMHVISEQKLSAS